MSILTLFPTPLYASIIGEQTSHLQAQVQRLLEIAYTDRSKLPLEKESLDVNALLQQAVNDLHPLIEQKNVVINTSFSQSGNIWLEDALMNGAVKVGVFVWQSQ